MSQEEMIDEQNKPESRVSAENQPAEHRQADTAGAFVPDIAKLSDDDHVYGPADDGKGKRLWKIPTLGWFVLGGLLLCGMAAGLKVILYEAPAPKENIRIAAGAEKVEKVLAQKEDESKKVRSLLARMDDCVRGYLKADSIDQKLAYVRHPRRVRPLMEKYYKDHQMVAEQFRQFAHYQAVGIDGSSFVYGRVELADGSSHDLLLEQLQDGSYRVDWESDVYYLPMPWDEFIISRPTQPLVMRVGATSDNFFAYEFSEDQYDCFKLTVRDSDDYLFGYAVKGSEASIAMRTFFMKTRKLAGDKAEPVTLMLRFPDQGVSKKSVHIERMMAPRWIFVHQHEAEVGKKKTEEP